MNSIVKINSLEGGQFNASQNRVSFELPAGKYYDLSTAYVNLVMSCDITAEAFAGNGVGTYIPNIQFQGTGANAENYAYSNSALVRTIKMDSELRGNIEEIQRADILSQNLNNYSKSTAMEMSKYYEKLIQPYNVSRTKGSIFCELNKEGNVLSRNLSRQPVRIKLTDMMNFAKTTQYNTNKYGTTRLEMTLNLDRLAAPTQELGAGNPASWVMANDAALSNTNNEQGRLVNATAAISGDLTTFYIACDSTNVNAGAGNGIRFRVYNRIQDSVYFVGMKVNIIGTYVQGTDPQARAGAVNVNRTITSIAYNRGDGAGSAAGINNFGTLAITLDSPIEASGNLAGTGTYHSLLLRGTTCTFGNGVVADFAELVVEEIDPSNVKPEPDTIQYTTYKTEEIDCGNVANFQHTFQAEPEAITMYITQPTDNTNRCILSRQNLVDNYRIRINNKDASSRNITLRDNGAAVRSNANDPLHTVKQQNALVNSERDVMDLKERMKNISINDGLTPSTFDTDLMLIGQVLPMTSTPKQVQVIINSRVAGGNALQNLCVFREVLAEI